MATVRSWTITYVFQFIKNTVRWSQVLSYVCEYSYFLYSSLWLVIFINLTSGLFYMKKTCTLYNDWDSRLPILCRRTSFSWTVVIKLNFCALHRVSQELRSLLRDLIPELIESKTSYTHWSNLQRFRSYEFLKFLKIRKERGALCIYWAMLLNVQLQINCSTLKKIVRSILHLLECIFWLVWPENL